VCRSIRPLGNLEPPASDSEIREAALQYVRKVGGTRKPSAANQASFDAAVEAVAAATAQLVRELVSNAPPRNRDVERARAHARWERRAARDAVARSR
jgi:hypothetical protein